MNWPTGTIQSLSRHVCDIDVNQFPYLSLIKLKTFVGAEFQNISGKGELNYIMNKTKVTCADLLSFVCDLD